MPTDRQMDLQINQKLICTNIWVCLFEDKYSRKTEIKDKERKKHNKESSLKSCQYTIKNEMSPYDAKQ